MNTKRLLLSLITFLLLTLTAKSQNNCFSNCKENLEKAGKVIVSNDSTLSITLSKRKQVMYNLVGCDLPGFSVETINEKVINSAELKGKIVVINFWFMSCVPCIAELPGLNRIVLEYNNEDIVFLGFTKDDKETINNDFLPKYKFDYQLIPIGNEIIDKFCISFGWPSNMVFDMNGKLRTVFTGGSKVEEVYLKLKKVIDECIDEK